MSCGSGRSRVSSPPSHFLHLSLFSVPLFNSLKLSPPSSFHKISSVIISPLPVCVLLLIWHAITSCAACFPQCLRCCEVEMCSMRISQMCGQNRFKALNVYCTLSYPPHRFNLKLKPCLWDQPPRGNSSSFSTVQLCSFSFQTPQKLLPC